MLLSPSRSPLIQAVASDAHHKSSSLLLILERIRLISRRSSSGSIMIHEPNSISRMTVLKSSRWRKSFYRTGFWSYRSCCGSILHYEYLEEASSVGPSIHPYLLCSHQLSISIFSSRLGLLFSVTFYSRGHPSPFLRYGMQPNLTAFRSLHHEGSTLFPLLIPLQVYNIFFHFLLIISRYCLGNCCCCYLKVSLESNGNDLAARPVFTGCYSQSCSLRKLNILSHY